MLKILRFSSSSTEITRCILSKYSVAVTRLNKLQSKVGNGGVIETLEFTVGDEIWDMAVWDRPSSIHLWSTCACFLNLFHSEEEYSLGNIIEAGGSLMFRSRLMMGCGFLSSARPCRAWNASCEKCP